MGAASYAHLRLHSEYSASEGAARLDAAVRRAADLDMPALALADFGNVFGAVKFYQACRSAGVKPIIGCDVAVGAPARPDNAFSNTGGDCTHLLLLCADYGGYQNLNRLLTRAYHDNNGVIAREELAADNHGLILLSGGERGDIGKWLRGGDVRRARDAAGYWKEGFGDRFYVETWRAAEDDGGLAAAFSEVAAAAKVPLVATHPVQCVLPDDRQMLEVRRCIANNWLLSDNSRPRPLADPPHLLSADEMQKRFADMPAALDNALEIAARCNLEFALGENHLPRMPLQKESAAEAVVRLSREGLKKLGLSDGEDYRRRLDFELGVINEMGYADYYLIVADFINWAKERDIPVGPGRGSGSASLAAFALGITEIDPIAHGLLFERFLNPERVSLPDFDIDFCVDGRDKVIEYVREKYGKDRVAQIVTFGQIGARSAVRDVGRVLGYPYNLCDRVARLIPGAPDMTLQKALEESPPLRREIQESDAVAELMELSKKVEGLPRNIGTHAGGVLIAPSPIVDFCPLYAAADTNSMVSQMDMTDIEKIGLVKFDFLGLKTLTILAAAEKMLRDAGEIGDDFSIHNLPENDKAVYESIYAKGDTLGVFQCESAGMRRLMEQLKPERFGDLVALIALYRPGAMQFMDSFIARKHGREQVEYAHPELETILEETYGLWVYQEQVMETARIVAGYSLGEADLLRRAMGKKKPEEMAKQEKRFVDGAEKKMGRAAAAKLFSQLAEFAEYGFNKAHAAAYAIISYRTAYMKAHYPAAFYAAVMSADAGDSDRIKLLADSASDWGITLIPPDLNAGRRNFCLAGEKKIHYGLQAIKGIGGELADEIARTRGGQPFANLFDFCKRMLASKLFTQSAAENLIFAGAMDCMHANRAAARDTLPAAMEDAGNQSAHLFGDSSAGALADTPPWSRGETMKNEQKALGFAVSGSFYELYRDFLRDANLSKKLSEVRGDESHMRIAGIFLKFQTPRALRQRGLEVAVVEDDTMRRFEILADSALWKQLGKLDERQSLLIVEGRAERHRNGGDVRARAERVYTMESFLAKRAKRLTVRCNDGASASELRETLIPAQSDNGKCEVVLEYEDRALGCEVSLGNKWLPGRLLFGRLTASVPGIRAVNVEYQNADL